MSELIPYNEYSSCPKCTSTHKAVRYHASCPDLGAEHIHLTCERCLYHWLRAPHTKTHNPLSPLLKETMDERA